MFILLDNVHSTRNTLLNLMFVPKLTPEQCSMMMDSQQKFKQHFLRICKQPNNHKIILHMSLTACHVI